MSAGCGYGCVRNHLTKQLLMFLWEERDKFNIDPFLFAVVSKPRSNKSYVSHITQLILILFLAVVSEHRSSKSYVSHVKLNNLYIESDAI